jgi:hypothetical protein
VDISVTRTADTAGASGTGLLAALLFDAIGEGNSLVQVNGVAFSGESAVKAVEVSLDGGGSWRAANFAGPILGPYAWRRFVLPIRLSKGDYAITSRAIAYDGSVQPENRVENERGYAHNGWRDHAVKVTVA